MYSRGDLAYSETDNDRQSRLLKVIEGYWSAAGWLMPIRSPRVNWLPITIGETGGYILSGWNSGIRNCQSAKLISSAISCSR